VAKYRTRCTMVHQDMLSMPDMIVSQAQTSTYCSCGPLSVPKSLHQYYAHAEVKWIQIFGPGMLRAHLLRQMVAPTL
jgi:hypothetical protein